MSDFEYIMVLTSLVLGLGISQILLGVSNLIKNRKSIRFYLPYMLTIFVVFGLHIQEWWINYNYSSTIMEWRFLLFVLVIIFPIFLFLLARLLFPLSYEELENLDMKAFYIQHYRKFYLCGLVMSVFAIPHNMIFLNDTLQGQLPQMVISGVLLLPVSIKTSNNVFHYSLSILLAGIGLFYVLIKNPTLS